MTKRNSSHTFGISLQQILTGHRSHIYQIAWSPDGRKIASVSQDKTHRIWYVPSGDQRWHFIQRSAPYNCLAWSPDGRLLAKGSEDTTVIVGDHKLDTVIHDDLQVLRGHPGPVTSVEWSPDGRMFASSSMPRRLNSQQDKSGSAEATVRIWDRRTWKLQVALKGDESTVWSIAWSGDGQTLVTGSEDRTVRLWDPETGVLCKTLKGHSDMVRCVKCSPDGRIIASASDDDTIRFWDSATGRSLAVLDEHTEAVTSISFSADARLLATKSDDSTVRIWRCDTRRLSQFSTNRGRQITHCSPV